MRFFLETTCIRSELVAQKHLVTKAAAFNTGPPSGHRRIHQKGTDRISAQRIASQTHSGRHQKWVQRGKKMNIKEKEILTRCREKVERMHEQRVHHNHWFMACVLSVQSGVMMSVIIQRRNWLSMHVLAEKRIDSMIKRRRAPQSISMDRQGLVPKGGLKSSMSFARCSCLVP